MDPRTSMTVASLAPSTHDTMIAQGDASSILRVQPYAAAAALKEWADHRLELCNGVQLYLAVVMPPCVAVVSLFGGDGGVGGRSGLADKLLDVMSQRRIASGPVLSGGVAQLAEVRTDGSNGIQLMGLDGVLSIVGQMSECS